MMSDNYTKIAIKKVETPSQESKVVYFELNKTPDKTQGDEGYALEINPTSIKFSANKPAGLFYAIQSFRQLLFPQLLLN